MVKIDKKDKLLLYFLSLNSRISHTQLAKALRLSKNTVKYRIQRLKKEGVIDKFASVVNLSALDYTTFTMLLRFNEDIYEKKEIIEYFRNHKLIDWAVTLSGQWDMFIELVVKDFDEFYKLVSEIIDQFGEMLNTYEVFFSNDILRVEHLITDFYKDLKLRQDLPEKRTDKKFEIDQMDRKILNILNQDSSLSYSRIAKELNTSFDVVRYRIRQLLNKRIIIKFSAEISLKKLGYTEYLYRIKLKNVSLEKMNSLKKRIQMHNSVTYAFFDISSFNLFFVCAFKTADEMDHLSRSLRKNYAEIIDDQEYLLIKEQLLFNMFPKGLVG